ncbi:hypothetical protein HDE76_001837 [Rhodanobacter sp. ANJX3]|uniref:hypothetical protein n=1 Tax=Rhodanobacter sp. ANJX3 TaxID=2723083 RepID=UPI00160D4949|nr:hypothetical protein [Rhodanobacter sp. ANJX3]MBB5358621.1 hypothetical protein [Rhodanobacter sp. ANJX3]
MTQNKPASAGIIKHAKLRSETIQSRITTALRAIEIDVENNDGIYPYNGGRLSQSEVCRRAGVHKVTLQGKSHKNSTRAEVEKWLAQIKRSLLSGQKVVRHSVTQRVDYWKHRYLQIAQWVDHYHLEQASYLTTIAQLEKQNTDLQFEVAKLQKALSNGTVVSIKKR